MFCSAGGDPGLPSALDGSEADALRGRLFPIISPRPSPLGIAANLVEQTGNHPRRCLELLTSRYGSRAPNMPFTADVAASSHCLDDVAAPFCK